MKRRSSTGATAYLIPNHCVRPLGSDWPTYDVYPRSTVSWTAVAVEASSAAANKRNDDAMVSYYESCVEHRGIKGTSGLL